jgi:four helix bundle protein
MDSYKASKAWHFGHSLALEVHQAAKQLPKDDTFHLSTHMRRTSSRTPLLIAKSIEHTLEHDKLACYEAARQAAIDLQEYLMLAHDVQYIERQAFQQMASKAITVQRLLTELIRSTKQTMTID